jgi:adenine-specific DNA-methyltransferase
MVSDVESIYSGLSQFINGSAAGLLQLLVSAARRTTFERIINCPTYTVPVKTSGLSTAVRQLREAMDNPNVHLPTFFARLYSSTCTLEHRKQVGQFFTATEVAEWAILKAEPKLIDDVCDAGAGAGIFADAILRTGISVRSYVGVENDPLLALCTAHVLESINAPDSYKSWYANFLLLQYTSFKARGLRVPNLIISNPPFVRFHNLSGRARIRASLKSSIGVMLSALSGSGSYFLLRAAELAGSTGSVMVEQRPNGRLLFFLPKEAAGAAHARRLRDDLQRLHGWTWRMYQIRNSRTGIDRHPSNSLAWFFVFEQKKSQVESRSRQSKPAACVRDIIQVKRGISTGCNEFFVLTDEEVRRRKIPQRRLRAILPTRIPITGNNFSESDWNLLRLSGHPCWLLVLPNSNIEEFEMHVQEYLKEGLRRGVHLTPTARSLRTWFSIPIPPTPPDVFATYLFRGAPRFVLNRARVHHLTNILGGRFVTSIIDPKRQEMIIDSLNIQAEQWIKSRMASREYKGGLRKIEPRELSMLPIDPAIVEPVNRENQAATESLFD